MFEISGRKRSQPAPAHVIWHDLTNPRIHGERSWVELKRGEVEPKVLRFQRPDLVVWSSIWPERPADEIHFHIFTDGRRYGADVGWTAYTVAEPSDELRTSVRHRINYLINASLRFSYGQ